MKRYLLALALCATTAMPAAAQIHGAFSEATIVPVNGRLGGAYLQFDASSATLQGQLRLSFYPKLDFGFNGGLSRIDFGGNTRTSVRLGGDFRGQVVAQGEGSPLNVTLGGAIGGIGGFNFGGLGIAVLSTNQGLVTDREARERNIGGEVLCHVW